MIDSRDISTVVVFFVYNSGFILIIILQLYYSISTLSTIKQSILMYIKVNNQI